MAREHDYRGRFAPSPTGPLHFGSLVTALASYLEARHHNGSWLVRIEDIDPLRDSPLASEQILASLDAHQLHSDEPVRYQSDRLDAYAATVNELLATGLAYRCICSRKELRGTNGYHPNHCRSRPQTAAGHAIRFVLQDAHTHWQDDLHGPQQQRIRAEADDPVIVRKEGFVAYKLAVIVDDIDQRISHIVRGSDLLTTTAQQLQMYHALKAPPPRWLHVPVITDRSGQKLSKQNHAPALDDTQPARNLLLALTFLGQQPPASLRGASARTVLEWASQHWQRTDMPRHSPVCNPTAAVL
ncbi:tRNA glutamyl-Q(34) synthetase GluQRS [Marinobacter sp. X15-166B]|uniref:tRNA glutamyl-Q(34) synthetase GluQRS n=1 Tax=Marinobacter sp. X15-166B TaxID=1897620 RepID=UPI00085CBDFD|nr:tRNA glutamyl-Q(34) synthetase GluQRS [Marinobacter sp. X15-166B]OEY66515.1 tRNA glutamyl-Q(34) synthetase GluQRS [Marinobacter sp. X15-166B]